MHAATFCGATRTGGARSFLAALATFGLAALLGACSAESSRDSASSTLITPERLDVPFVSSAMFSRVGERDAQSGACTFAADLRLEEGELAAGQTKVRVQRAYDLARCEEWLEEGVVDAWDLLDPASAEESQYAFSESDAKLLDVPRALDATTYSATGRVSYVDARSPLATTLSSLGLTERIDVAYVEIALSFTPGGCGSTPSNGGARFSYYSQLLLGWTTQSSSDRKAISCTQMTGEARAIFENNVAVPLVMDCSDGAYIQFAPTTMHLSSNGSRALYSNDSVTGDRAQCGEYLVRVESLR